MENVRESYLIHNTSRVAAKKFARQQLSGPDRSRLNLNIGKLVVRRGRPLQVSSSVLMCNLAALIDLEAKGLVEVFTARSGRVNLASLKQPTIEVVGTTVVEAPAPSPVVVVATPELTPVEEPEQVEQTEDEGSIIQEEQVILGEFNPAEHLGYSGNQSKKNKKRG